VCGVRIQTLRRPWLYELIGIVGVVIAFDQWTKQWMETNLADGPITVIDGVLWWSYTENNGAAFGMLQGGGTLLGIAALVATAIIVWNLSSVETPLELVGLALIMSGALGNLVDRIVRGEGFLDGAVIDFIRVPDFPNFNVADSAITIGVVLLLAATLRGRGAQEDARSELVDDTPPGGMSPNVADNG